MKGQGSIQKMIFHNLREECMPMTSWIGLNIVERVFEYEPTPPPQKKKKINKKVKLVAIKMSKNVFFFF